MQTLSERLQTYGPHPTQRNGTKLDGGLDLVVMAAEQGGKGSSSKPEQEAGCGAWPRSAWFLKGRGRFVLVKTATF